MDREGLGLSEFDEAHLRGLLRGADLATDRATEEADRKLLAHLAVVVDGHVARVRVDAEDLLHLRLDPGFLAHLPNDGLVMLSPGSIEPPGIDQYSLSVRLWRRMRPASSTTTADAAGTRLFAFGAFGSSSRSRRGLIACARGQG